MTRRLLNFGGILSLFVFASVLFAAAPISAQPYDPFKQPCANGGATSEVCKVEPTDPVSGKDGVLITALNILSFIVGVASVMMVILGGFKYIMSNGDSNAVSNAKNTILYAIIGLVVFLSSQLIIRFVISKL